ncbi:MAG: hypothetical protein NTU53_17020 [Planctomycetota bacterium]|nr:hypothetical protein [Planctomycetota bacterium]
MPDHPNNRILEFGGIPGHSGEPRGFNFIANTHFLRSAGSDLQSQPRVLDDQMVFPG